MGRCRFRITQNICKKKIAKLINTTKSYNVVKIRDIVPDNRPRERLAKQGVSALSDSELLALILCTGNKKENVIDMSNRLLSVYGIDKLSDCSLTELQKISGIGKAKASQILALFEFNKRHYLAKKNLTKINSAKDVYELMKEKLTDLKQELLMVLYLDRNKQILKEEIITKGTLDSSLVHPREVFKGAIKESAHSIVLIHNHPSGDCTPTKCKKSSTDIKNGRGCWKGYP